MEFTINFKGLDTLATAITTLATALTKPSQIQAAAPIMQETMTAPAIIQEATPPVIPTAFVAQEYTLEQIQLAMSGLIDAGKIQAVMELMRSFGVDAIIQMPCEQYPALVLRLRELGANL